MLKAKFGVMALAVGGCVLVGISAFLLFELRAMEKRLARLEGEAAARASAGKAARAERPAGDKGVAERGPANAGSAASAREPDLEAVQGDVRRLGELVATLQAKLGEVTQKAETLEKENAKHAALMANLNGAAVSAEGAGADKKEATAAMQMANYKAWMQSELDKIADAVGLTDAQKDRARQALKELMAKWFPKDGGGENPWEHWNDFNKEYKDALKRQMTSEQQNQYATYEKKQIQEQVSSSATWTVSTMEEACGLDSGQRDRIAAKVKDYYTTVYTQYSEGGAGADAAQIYDPKKLKEALISELTSEQMPKFEEWFKTYLGGNGWTESK